MSKSENDKILARTKLKREAFKREVQNMEFNISRLKRLLAAKKRQIEEMEW
jgi:hypothetical protein